MSCAICGAAEQRVHRAREMMFGLREPFEYGECEGCGALALLDVPEDLSRYYPGDYYSFAGAEAVNDQPAIAAIKRARAELALRLPVSVVERLVQGERLPELFRWMAGMGLHTWSRIVDVGSGDGQNLVDMLRQGFSALSGYDPYLPEDRLVAGRVPLRRAAVSEIDGLFDLVTVHHAFEHMPEPRSMLNRLAGLLAPGGALLLRIPVADSWAWQHYGVNWVGLDPPRHLFIQTTRSMEILAQQCGLEIHRIFRDGYALQLWGSELYERDVPLRENSLLPHERAAQVFSPSQMADFDRHALELNRRATGDSAGFVLKHKR